MKARRSTESREIAGERTVAIRRFAPLTLMPVAAFGVHQLRYWLAYGSRASVELERQGHSYLHSVVPWLVLLVAVCLGVFLRALGRALGGGGSAPRYTLSFTALWLACASCLLAIYTTQEFLEGLLATGHPGGLAGIFGYGGWWSIPAAAAVGLIVAAILYGARWALHEIAERSRRALPAPRPLRLVAPVPRAVLLARRAPLCVGWSDRGPPQLAR